MFEKRIFTLNLIVLNPHFYITTECIPLCQGVFWKPLTVSVIFSRIDDEKVQAKFTRDTKKEEVVGTLYISRGHLLVQRPTKERMETLGSLSAFSFSLFISSRSGVGSYAPFKRSRPAGAQREDWSESEGLYTWQTVFAVVGKKKSKLTISQLLCPINCMSRNDYCKYDVFGEESHREKRMTKSVTGCISYFFAPLAPCPAECKGTAGSRGTEEAEVIAVLPELPTDQATGATYRHYRVWSPSLLPTSTHRLTHIQLYVMFSMPTSK